VNPAAAPGDADGGVLGALARAASLEHHLACGHWFAAWAVDTLPGVPGRSEDAARAARRARQELTATAERHLSNVVQVGNLHRALGGGLQVGRPDRPDLIAAVTAGLLAGDPHDGVRDDLAGLYARVAEQLAGGGAEVVPAPDQPVTGFLGLAGPIQAVAGPDDAAEVLQRLRRDAEAVGAAGTAPPARPVTTVPIRQPHGPGRDGTLLLDPRTRAVAELFSSAYGLVLTLLTHLIGSEPRDDRIERATLRLQRSVVRPLGEALTQLPVDVSPHGRYAGPTFAEGDEVELVGTGVAPLALLDERTWDLAVAATSARVRSGFPGELQEASAALQELACRFAAAEGPGSAAQRMSELAAIQSDLDVGLQPEPDGPYLATNVHDLKDWLGQTLPSRAQLALCRCGASESKPYCDGSHARVDFTDAKSDDRLADRRDTYAGQQVTVLDNRGTCAHSGFCTDRLNTVFHLGEEPFVTPSGARMDEIVRAVRSCPSGALSYALAAGECRDEVDQSRPAAVEVSKDGPYRITGGIALSQVDGGAVVRNEGASVEHYSLCRCGHSQNKPFCSGMHWYVDFHDPVPDPDRTPTIFEWAGGYPALLRMTSIFYEKHVPEDPLIGQLFSTMETDHPERVARWLSEVFGGPPLYSHHYGGYNRMLSQHVGKRITEDQRARWAMLISRSADEAGLPRDAEFRSAFAAYIEWGSRLAVENSQTESKPPPRMPMPRWDWGTAGPPTGRVSALPSAEATAVEEEPAVLPAEGEDVGFERHVRTFFRRRDRQSMLFAFDLWSYEDVVRHGEAITRRVREGTMPCDMTWPQEQTDALQRWVDSGMAP